jgi:hypothetical protein
VTTTKLAAAADAADTLLDGIRTRIDTGPAELDVRDLLAELETAFTAAGRDAHPVTSAVQVVVGTYNSTAVRHDTNIATRHARTRIRDIARAIDQALVVFDRQADLDDAHADLDRLEREAADALSRLQAAVEQADVPAVMTLRGEVEVGYPGKLEQAQLRILDLQIEKADATCAAPRARVEQKRAVEQKATEAAEAAKAEWERLEQIRQDAAAALGAASAAAADTERHVAELQQERADLASRHQVEATNRVRRLAGLDGAPHPDVPEPSEEPPLRSLSYQTVTSYTERALREIEDAEYDGPIVDLTPRIEAAR